MARTRNAAKLHQDPVNGEGMTWAEWHRAVGKECKMQHLKSDLIAAWEAGEDPCDWRAEAERAARTTVKP